MVLRIKIGAGSSRGHQATRVILVNRVEAGTLNNTLPMHL